MITYQKLRDEIADLVGLEKEDIKAVQRAMHFLMKKHMKDKEAIQLLPGVYIEPYFVPEHEWKLPTGEIVTVAEHYNYTPRLGKSLQKLDRKGRLFKNVEYDGVYRRKPLLKKEDKDIDEFDCLL